MHFVTFPTADVVDTVHTLDKLGITYGLTVDQVGLPDGQVAVSVYTASARDMATVVGALDLDYRDIITT